MAAKQTATEINPNKALWEKGDFTQIAASMRDERRGRWSTGSASPRASRCSISAAATGRRRSRRRERGAEVLGVDIARNLVEAGNRRAAAEGLTNLRFQEGDASDLPDLGDERFDLVVSIFGAMFAPRPFDVAKEMVRVTRPGGRIVMGNWIPGDPTLVAQILKISSAYSPPPPEGFVSPMTWGVDEHVVERFTAAGVPEANIACERDTFVFEQPTPPVGVPGGVPGLLRPDDERVRGRRGERARADELQAELEVLFNEQNQSADGESTSIPATFLRVTVTR